MAAERKCIAVDDDLAYPRLENRKARRIGIRGRQRRAVERACNVSPVPTSQVSTSGEERGDRQKRCCRLDQQDKHVSHSTSLRCTEIRIMNPINSTSASLEIG